MSSSGVIILLALAPRPHETSPCPSTSAFRRAVPLAAVQTVEAFRLRPAWQQNPFIFVCRPFSCETENFLVSFSTGISTARTVHHEGKPRLPSRGQGVRNCYFIYIYIYSPTVNTNSRRQSLQIINRHQAANLARASRDKTTGNLWGLVVGRTGSLGKLL